MKQGIHPEYKTAVVTCACGNTFTTRSTLESIHVEICSRCHPFFTGRQKLVDTAGRVERFRRKYGEGEKPRAGKGKAKKAAAAAPKATAPKATAPKATAPKATAPSSEEQGE